MTNWLSSNPFKVNVDDDLNWIISPENQGQIVSVSCSLIVPADRPKQDWRPR